MSTPMSRQHAPKRGRSQAYPDRVEDGDLDVPTTDSFDADVNNRQVKIDRSETEREVWDAFREENFEAIEQMPLTLHRQFTLMSELDQQAHSYTSDLLPTLRQYIWQRRAMALPHSPKIANDIPSNVTDNPEPYHTKDTSLKQERPPTPPPIFPLSLPNGAPPSPHPPLDSSFVTNNPSTPIKRLRSEYISTPRTPTPMGVPPERVKVPQTTREMLSHIAWLSEEFLRTSEEKVNLAQAAYDSVGRHIRLLDQAIKEQEASISLGIRSGSHQPPFLPEITAPRLARPTRTTLSPIPNFSGNGEFEGSQNTADGGVDEGWLVPVTTPIGGPTYPHRRRGKKGKWARKKLENEVSDEPQQAGVGSLKIIVPPMPPVHPPEMVIDPAEPRYCYCNQVSFGEMIACDNTSCGREWFHLKCAGFTESPTTTKKWYCRDCTLNKSRKRK